MYVCMHIGAYTVYLCIEMHGFYCCCQRATMYNIVLNTMVSNLVLKYLSHKCITKVRFTLVLVRNACKIMHFLDMQAKHTAL